MTVERVAPVGRSRDALLGTVWEAREAVLRRSSGRRGSARGRGKLSLLTVSLFPSWKRVGAPGEVDPCEDLPGVGFTCAPFNHAQLGPVASQWTVHWQATPPPCAFCILHTHTLERAATQPELRSGGALSLSVRHLSLGLEHPQDISGGRFGITHEQCLAHVMISISGRFGCSNFASVFPFGPPSHWLVWFPPKRNG